MSIEMPTSPFQGVYVAPEAALYLTATLKRDVPTTALVRPVSSRNLIRWIRVGLTSPGLAHVPGKELLVTFEDVISMRVIALLRALGVTWPRIHRAEQWLREQTNYPRPFAVQRVWTETKDVFADFPGVLVAASRQGQLAFIEVFGQYLQPVGDMTFVRRNGVNVAATWTPHVDVLINPKIQFGEPCVHGTRIPTRTLWRMWNGGDSVLYLTRTFELSEQEIEHALEWEDRLSTAKGP